MFKYERKTFSTRRVALVGNPNVGKSTVFNRLTGLRQHTGNWPGKTVEVATGRYRHGNYNYELTDLPGTYSLLAHSPEEEVARDHLCTERPDCAVVVCDATALLRGMNLVLQTMELIPQTVVCVNLMDEAAKQHLTIDTERLSRNLGVPVVGTSARDAHGLLQLRQAIEAVCETPPSPPSVRYTDLLEKVTAQLTRVIAENDAADVPARWLALRLLEEGEHSALPALLGVKATSTPILFAAAKQERQWLSEQGIDPQKICDMLVSCLLLRSEEMCFDAVNEPPRTRRSRDILLSDRRIGVPLMLLMLFAVFWLTIEGANLPSAWLTAAFAQVERWLDAGLIALSAPETLRSLLVDGMFHVLSWVVAVMLPPMAIFFPLFTLLEDLGVLPRIAFQLDSSFRKACTCGKQALTMCMGLGCNAVGVTGCRIIDSPRERTIAILTNAFVPCNGRFPTLITLITLFLVGTGGGRLRTATGALGLTAVMLLGFGMTLLWSKVLSKTLLKGTPSSFALELPPYRAPQWGKVLVRSLLDRTLFVLGRAVAVAAPAGALIWFLANTEVNGASLLAQCIAFLEPIGRFFGMDGVILMAFLLGSPANEIVVPLIVLGYSASGGLQELGTTELHTLLLANGWTPLTAVCVIVCMAMHWPCTTTCLTIYKETHSIWQTAVAVLLPTVTGFSLCAIIATVGRLF